MTLTPLIAEAVTAAGASNAAGAAASANSNSKSKKNKNAASRSARNKERDASTRVANQRHYNKKAAAHSRAATKQGGIAGCLISIFF